jgi:thiaminase II
MVSTSGHRLLPEDAIAALKKRLLSMTTIITPNIPEAALLIRGTSQELDLPNSLDEVKNMAKQVFSLGPKAVLLKGGHVPMTSAYVRAKDGETPSLIVDVLFDGVEFTFTESAYSASKNTHGTGCSLASAVAANLAKGKPLQTAVREACRYVEAGIKTSFELGKGNGPINHFHSLQALPFAAGYFVEYLLERADVRPLWKAFTQHEFVRAIGDGTLPLDAFKRFLVQDYLYLTQFARTNALAAYKGADMEDIVASAQIVLGVHKEMELHVEYCREFGISKEEMERSKESQATVAYSRYVLDVGQSGDWLGLQIALASCLIGYQVAAEWVKAQSGSREEGNRYWKWVDNYGGGEYAEGVKLGRAMIERHAIKVGTRRLEELVKTFIRVTEMEINFWEFDAHLR